MKANVLVVIAVLVGAVSAQAKWGGTRAGTEPVGYAVNIHCEGKETSLDFKFDEHAGNFASYSFTKYVAGKCPSRNCGSYTETTFSGSTDEAGTTATFSVENPYAKQTNYSLDLTNTQDAGKDFQVLVAADGISHQVVAASIGGALIEVSDLKCVQK